MKPCIFNLIIKNIDEELKWKRKSRDTDGLSYIDNNKFEIDESSKICKEKNFTSTFASGSHNLTKINFENQKYITVCSFT